MLSRACFKFPHVVANLVCEVTDNPSVFGIPGPVALKLSNLAV